MSEYITEIIVTKEEKDKNTNSRVSFMKVSFDTYKELFQWGWSKLSYDEKLKLHCCKGCGSLHTDCRGLDTSIAMTPKEHAEYLISEFNDTNKGNGNPQKSALLHVYEFLKVLNKLNAIEQIEFYNSVKQEIENYD